jgi:hypothetical protein
LKYTFTCGTKDLPEFEIWAANERERERERGVRGFGPSGAPGSPGCEAHLTCELGLHTLSCFLPEFLRILDKEFQVISILTAKLGVKIMLIKSVCV